MASVYHSAENIVFTKRRDLEQALLTKIDKGAAGYIGTELELFVTGPEGLPITFDQVELLLEHMQSQFPHSQGKIENGRMVALHIPDVGDVCLEPGGQVELAVKPCMGLKELEFVNKTLRDALDNAVNFFDLRIVGTGHLPSFLQAGDMPRSRFGAYYAYCRDVHGVKAEDLIKTMKSVCGLQVNLDPMGKDFHEVYRALMLVEIGVSFASNSVRRERLETTYSRLFPEQTTPLFGALRVRSNEDLVELIVDRLLTLKLPFVPDRSSKEGFSSTKDIFGNAPTLGELLQSGSLTGEIFDNALSLQLMMPNLRRHGVLETRAPDSVDSVEELMNISRLYEKYAYDPESRQSLLDAFSGVAPDLLEKSFQRRFDAGVVLSALPIGGGKTIADLVSYIGGFSLLEQGRRLQHGHASPKVGDRAGAQDQDFFRRP